MPKHYFNSAVITINDEIIVNVTKVYEDGGQLLHGMYLSDAALTAHAVADGRTTWDNSDLYALTPCEPWPTVETVPEQVEDAV